MLCKSMAVEMLFKPLLCLLTILLAPKGTVNPHTLNKKRSASHILQAGFIHSISLLILVCFSLARSWLVPLSLALH